MLRRLHSAKIPHAQAGFSLIELSIAVLIALFLLGGLVTLVMGTRRSSSTQTALSQLQDNERIAMTVIGNVVQKAGYFPDPVNQTLSSFTAETFATVTMASGQVLGGTANAAAPGDRLMVRFFAPASDPNASVIDCAGQSNPAPSSAPNSIWYTNMFQVVVVGSTSWLQCQSRINGAGTVLTVNLIPNVTQIAVLYGVSVGGTTDDYSVVQYQNATQVTAAAAWANVTAVKVTLTFLQPAYGTTGGQMSTTQTAIFTRVIPIMSRAGVDT
jgi:type IV pilus assembly protein PilW